MGAGREHLPTQGGGGDGGGAPPILGGVAGASAQGQAAEINAAPTAGALRGRTRAAARAEGEAFSEQLLADMPPVSPQVPQSHFAQLAANRGQGGALDAWAGTYDGARTPLGGLARQLGVLKVMATRGVDWQQPAAYGAELAQWGDLQAQPEVSAAKAQLNPTATASPFADWQAALAQVQAARAGVRSAAQMAGQILVGVERRATDKKLLAATARQQRVDGAVALLVEIAKFGVTTTELDWRKAASTALDWANKAGLVRSATQFHRAEVARLKAQIARLDALAEDHAVQAAKAGMAEAAATYEAALAGLTAAERRVAAAQAEQATKVGHLGSTLDAQRATHDAPAQPAAGPQASDRATVLLRTAQAVQLAQQAAGVALQLLAQTAGPDLVDALFQGAQHGLLLGEAFWAHGPTAAVQEAADLHRIQRDGLETLAEPLTQAADGWARAVGPITES